MQPQWQEKNLSAVTLTANNEQEKNAFLYEMPLRLKVLHLTSFFIQRNEFWVYLIERSPDLVLSSERFSNINHLILLLLYSADKIFTN